MFLDLINTLAFWIALGIGMWIAYTFAPVPKVIYKYPTPENAGKVLYVDKSGVCYKYKAVEVNCLKNKTNVKPIVR